MRHCNFKTEDEAVEWLKAERSDGLPSSNTIDPNWKARGGGAWNTHEITFTHVIVKKVRVEYVPVIKYGKNGKKHKKRQQIRTPYTVRELRWKALGTPDVE